MRATGLRALLQRNRQSASRRALGEHGGDEGEVRHLMAICSRVRFGATTVGMRGVTRLDRTPRVAGDGD